MYVRLLKRSRPRVNRERGLETGMQQHYSYYSVLCIIVIVLKSIYVLLYLLETSKVKNLNDIIDVYNNIFPVHGDLYIR